MGLYAFPSARASKSNQQICISPGSWRSSRINAHRCWNWHCAFQTGCLEHVIGIVFFKHNFSAMKRMCWTTGSWRSCLSLEVVSSISTGSTINHRFLCGYICVSLCQSIKIKPANILIGLTHRGAHHMLYLWCRRVALSPRAPHTKAHVSDDRDIWLTCWFHLAKEHTVYVFSP